MPFLTYKYSVNFLKESLLIKVVYGPAHQHQLGGAALHWDGLSFGHLEGHICLVLKTLIGLLHHGFTQVNPFIKM